MHFFNQLFKLAILSDSKGTFEYTVQARNRPQKRASAHNEKVIKLTLFPSEIAVFFDSSGEKVPNFSYIFVIYLV